MKTNLILIVICFLVAVQTNASKLPVHTEPGFNGDPNTATVVEKPRKVSKAEKQLAGKWVNSKKPYNVMNVRRDANTDMEGVFLKYQFKQDGTYVKLVGSESVEVLERGFWQISEDKSYIFFYVSEDGTAEHIKSTQFARITKLTNNTMKIAFALQSSEVGAQFNTSYKEFTFNKK